MPSMATIAGVTSGSGVGEPGILRAGSRWWTSGHPTRGSAARAAASGHKPSSRASHRASHRETGSSSSAWRLRPARYRATTPESCTFERRSEFSGDYYDENRYIDEGSAGRSRVLAIVDIEPTDTGFESEGCAWSADLTPRSRPGQPFRDGTHVVGSEVAPGRYRARPAGGLCSWTRLGKFGGSYGNDTGVVGRWWVRGRSAVVDIAPTDAGFFSEGCGEWSPDLSPSSRPANRSQGARISWAPIYRLAATGRRWRTRTGAVIGHD